MLRKTFAPLAALALLLSSAAAFAAPKADLWAMWDKHDSGSETVVDHSAWTALLGSYVKTGGPQGVNLFDYGGVSSADKSKLDGYIKALTNRDPRALNKAEQKAYWINLYNAVTIQVVLDDYPVDSIRDIKDGFFSSGPWDRELVTVAGEKLTLNDIEHRILRPIWDDPLIHYGVNCASIGCPNLLTEAFTGKNVDDKLAENAVAYANSPRGARFDGSKLIVSSIYEWFKVDFGDSEAGVLKHLAQYATGDKQAKLKQRDDYSKHAYSWDLNDTK